MGKRLGELLLDRLLLEVTHIRKTGNDRAETGACLPQHGTPPTHIRKAENGRAETALEAACAVSKATRRILRYNRFTIPHEPGPRAIPRMSSSSRASARRVLRFAPWLPHNWYDNRLSPTFQPNQTTDGLSKDERQVSPEAILSPFLHLGMQCPGVTNGVGEERRVLGGSPRHHALEQHLVGVDCKSFIDKQRATK